jgi:hypothetical protein
MKIPFLRSFLYGLIICLIVLILATLINQFYHIDAIITGAVSLIGVATPAIVEKLSQTKVNTEHDIIIGEIKEIEKHLQGEMIELTKLINHNENSIISITSYLGCFRLQDIMDELNKLRTEIELLKRKND